MKKLSLILVLLISSYILSFSQNNTKNSKKSDLDDLNDILEQLDEGKLNNGMASMLKQMQESQQNVKFEPSYTFTLHTKVKSEIVENGKKETFVMDFYSSSNASMMKPNANNTELKNEMAGLEEANIIFDTKNKTIITLDEKKKEGMAMSTGGFEGMAKMIENKYGKDVQAKETKPNYTMTKTGKSKMILGYLCEEYLVITKENKENTETRMWVTKETSIGFFNIMEAMGKSMMAKSNLYKEKLKGAVLELHSKNLNNGNIYSMTVLEINKKNTIKDLSKYKISSGFDFDMKN